MVRDVAGDGIRHETGEAVAGAHAPPNVGRRNVGSVRFDQNHACFDELIGRSRNADGTRSRNESNVIPGRETTTKCARSRTAG